MNLCGRQPCTICRRIEGRRKRSRGSRGSA
jgi:hypothetical protein